MPRKPRFQLPGIPQHIVQRGNNRDPCFFADADYRRYLEDLENALEANRCDLHAYVLMTNHVHLLITPQTEYGLSHTMQDTGRRYVSYINRSYGRTGTLWEGRYKASLVDSEAYLLTCMRYIEMNPVRTAMVKHPGDYCWSSYAANGGGQPDSIVHPHTLYLQLGMEEAGRQFAYRELFRHAIGADCLHKLRESLNHDLVLGREVFKDRIAHMTRRQVRRGKNGRPGVQDGMGEYTAGESGILGKIGI